jgi:WD40 repeat protein/serine/threonine protein kinase
MARLSISLLGAIQVSLDGEPVVGFNSNKVRALLAYLVTEAERPHQRDKLAALLWPETSSREARNNLRYALSNLRGVIQDRLAEPPFLLISRETIQFNRASDYELDVAEFAELVSSPDIDASTVRQLEGAVQLHPGDFLEGFSIDDSVEFDEWVLLKREKFIRQLSDALYRLAGYYEGEGDYKQALVYARRQVAIEAWSEEANRQVMRLLTLSGQRGAALVQYDNLATILETELDTEPEEETRALYEQIREDEFLSPSPKPAERRIRGYEVHEILGKGHVGVVYRAYQPVVGRDVAVKVIHPEYSNRPDFIRRFEREARLVARLEHPHIVPLYDFWREPDGAYLVMRWIRGGSLATTLERGPWNLGPAVRTVEQISAALTMAHQQGVVHRDIKPANILLDQSNNAYLSDFGIAAMIWESSGEITDPDDDTSGSLGYISPEAARGESNTPLMDVYSLGVVLYEMLAGRHPFPELPGKDLIEKHLKEPLPSIREVRPEIPAVIDEIIQQATAKDPRERFLDAISMAEALRQKVQDDHVAPPVVVPGMELRFRNPYKGLRPFQEADAADFFGREALIGKLLSRMSSGPPRRTTEDDGLERSGAGGRFLTLVGPSGSGKSSVINAGLLPALRRNALPGSSSWFLVQMTPGTHPLDELEIGLLKVSADETIDLKQLLWEGENGLLEIARSVLPAEEGELLLVVDQFEEIFAKGIDEVERERFIQNICAAVGDPGSRVRVVITLRADFYDRPLRYPEFNALVAENTEVLLPLTSEELTKAIEGPADRIGVEFEPGLVAAIAKDVDQTLGTLPMLQYALTELFEHRQERRLTHAGYETIGGVSGALVRRAEEVYNQLDETSQDTLRQLFLRLTTLGEGVEDTRRRVLRSELEALSGGQLEGQLVDDILDLCGRARLLTFDHDPATRQPTVDIAHEALLREWHRLREWLDDNREDIRTQRSLAAAADEWLLAGKDSSFLVRGSRLEQFDGWANTTDLALTENELDFLETSLAERGARQAGEAARKEREASLEQRSRLFLRALVGIFALAAIIALGLTAIAFNQRRQALEAYSLSLAANAQQAMNDLDNATGLVLALAANRIDDPPLESQRILMNAAYAPGPRGRYDVESIFVGVETPATAVAISPDGDAVLLGFADGTIVLWDLATGEESQRFFGHTAGINEIVFSPDGGQALSAGDDARVLYWDLSQGVAIYHLYGHSGEVRAVDISPDGLTAVSGGFSGASFENPGELILWDLGTGAEIRRFEGHVSGVVEAVFAQGGDTILAASGDAELFSDFGTEITEVGADLFDMVLWDTNSGEVLGRFETLDHDAYAIAVTSEVSQALVASYYDNVASLWDLVSGEKVLTFEGHHDSIRSVVIGPDDRWALTASDDDRLILWDLGTGEMILQLAAHSSDVLDVVFSPDGRSAISTARDGGVILWDLHDAAEIKRFLGHQDMVWDTAFTPDGLRFLSASGAASPAVLSQDTSIRLWSLETGEQIETFDVPAPAQVIFQIAITPDGRTALFTTNEPFVRIWDLQNWVETGRLEGHEGWIPGLDISADGRYALTCSVDGTLIYWDLHTGEGLHRLDGHGKGLWSVAISPDGRTALSDSGDVSMILWDLESGKEIRSFVPEGGWDEPGSSGIAFMPDGDTAIAASNGGYIIHWDLATGKELRRFGRHNDIRTRIEISQDGRVALSSGMDGTFMLWDIEKGELIREFSGGEQVTVFDISMSPEGLTALSGSSDRTIIHWQLMNLSLDELKDWIDSNRYVRPLTCEERDLYRIEPLCEP